MGEHVTINIYIYQSMAEATAITIQNKIARKKRCKW